MKIQLPFSMMSYEEVDACLKSARSVLLNIETCPSGKRHRLQRLAKEFLDLVPNLGPNDKLYFMQFIQTKEYSIDVSISMKPWHVLAHFKLRELAKIPQKWNICLEAQHESKTAVNNIIGLFDENIDILKIKQADIVAFFKGSGSLPETTEEFNQMRDAFLDLDCHDIISDYDHVKSILMIRHTQTLRILFSYLRNLSEEDKIQVLALSDISDDRRFDDVKRLRAELRLFKQMTYKKIRQQLTTQKERILHHYYSKDHYQAIKDLTDDEQFDYFYTLDYDDEQSNDYLDNDEPLLVTQAKRYDEIIEALTEKNAHFLPPKVEELHRDLTAFKKTAGYYSQAIQHLTQNNSRCETVVDEDGVLITLDEAQARYNALAITINALDAMFFEELSKPHYISH